MLPQIKSMHPLANAPYIYSSKDMKKSPWSNLQQSPSKVSQPTSTKNLHSQRSKPFSRAIIEEVTKEHFFTRESAMHAKRRQSADITETSFGTTGFNRLQNSKPKQSKFNKRAFSMPGAGQSEPIKLEIPPECKILCFCGQKHMQMPPVLMPH